MTFGELLRKLREGRKMTLRQLGEAAGMDYVVLNKVELGLRMAPRLEDIIALADALTRARPIDDGDFERLLDLAAEPNKDGKPRFTRDAVERLKESRTADVFFTRRSQSDEGGE